jgi:hypothetical protein
MTKKKHDVLPFVEFEERLIERLTEHRNTAAKKFPLGFAVLATLGVLMTMQGLSKLLEKIPLVHNNPWISFVSGLALLLTTGTLYKKLG